MKSILVPAMVSVLLSSTSFLPLASVAQPPEPPSSSATAPSQENISSPSTQNTGQGESAAGDHPAIEELREAIKQKPLDSETHLRLGSALAATGDLPGALTEFRESLRLKPGTMDARLYLADTLYRMGDSEEALEEYRALVHVQPDLTQAHLNLATALMAKQEWRAALAELQEVLRLDPTLAQAHYNLGTVHYTMGNRQAAIQSYREALRLKPDFVDAHYHLGLVLKLTKHDVEAAEELRTAAESGVARAQYFLGNAYRSGQGVEKNMALAISWWIHAAQQGMSPASEALAQLRQATFTKGSRNQKDTQAAIQAFREYRNHLSQQFPDLVRSDEEERVGSALMKVGRVQEALPVLIQEAYALDESAQTALEKLYEEGAEQLPPYDLRILSYLHTSASEGFPRSRLMLAQIYAKGLGVAPDAVKAKALLKGFSKVDSKKTTKETGTRPKSP